MTINVGDKCSVSIHGLFARHHGVCVGHDWRGCPVFIHNSYERGSVTEATLEEFARGRHVRVDQRPRRGEEYVVVRRARSLLGRKYDLVNFNCEHAATYAATGTARSMQVLTVVGVGLVAAVAGVAIVFNAGGSGDRR